MTRTAPGAVVTAAEPMDAQTRRGLRRRGSRKADLAAFAFVFPVVVYVLIFFLYPIIRTGQLSLTDFTFASYFSGEADFIGLANYGRILLDPLFTPIVLQTVVFTVVSLLFQYLAGLALAVFFSRNFPLSIWFRSLILIPWLLPVIVSATTWRWMFYKDYGIVNAVLGTDIGWLSDPNWSLVAVVIANIWLGIPFNLVLLYSGIQSIPTSLYEAAAVDGAGRWRTFASITWPLLKPVTTVTLLLGLVYTIKAFDIIWVMTKGGPFDHSHTLATWSYELSFEGGTEQSLSLGATVAILLFLVSFALGLFYVRTQRKEMEL
ncbi:carbohydrate ABC transporter permease [Rathayibacter sp. Leaf248]|uniref:carbohydrate ABC transporter permease n=1 Tax=Rathayibacter sp. Leaf248 TaxID=2876555 RepID=UPI001E349C23|nr:sugar ABC transporter permease [Rathayibacter sp. Leaf248]